MSAKNTCKCFPDRVKQGLIKFLELDKYSFEKIALTRQVVNSIIQLSKDNHPREFVALLRGRVKKHRTKGKSRTKGKTLVIHSLIYRTYEASPRAAIFLPQFLTITDTIGSVHSHPGYSNSPSRADLRFFSKNGMVHLIICRPYAVENIQAYDPQGRKISFSAFQKPAPRDSLY